MSFSVYLTNWSSPGLRGPGDPFGIMRRPRSFEVEASAGTVRNLCPAAVDLDDMRAGRIEIEEYRRRFESGVARIGLGIELGQHRHEILKDLGYSDADIESLAKGGAI